MLIVKGFCSSDVMTDNAPGVVANYGEISTYSLTYAKEVHSYVIPAQPTHTLYTFKVSQDGVTSVLEDTVRDHMISVAAYAYSQMNSSTGLSSAQFASLILTQFSSSVIDVTCGDMVTNNTSVVPSWIAWKNTSISGLGDNYLKVWLSDAAFKTQYDEYEITIVPPIAVIDDFFKGAATVSLLMNSVNATSVVTALQNAKGNSPETIQFSLGFNYVDPVNNTNTIATSWSGLIYGAAGNNPDAISDALIAYILANTTHTRAEWVTIFPDIFKRTEFTLVPLWDQYAIPNRSVQSGIYSPIVSIARIIALYKSIVVGYSSAQVDLYLEVLSHPYKSLQILSCGGSDNRNNVFKVENLYPDYINVQTTSADFARMIQATQDWTLSLTDLILTAETATSYTTLPSGISRVMRDGNLYVTKRINNVVFFVLTKQSIGAGALNG